MMSKYGVLLVSGRRTHQEGHAAAFAAHPLCRLVAVADEGDVTETRAVLNRQLAEDYDIPYIPDLDEALAQGEVDIVSMCADVERRGRVAAHCAEAGKHLYLDKPLAGSVEDADTIVSSIKSSGVRSQMFTLIHTSWAQRARRAVEEGRLGELVAVHAEFLMSKGPAGTVPAGTVRRESRGPRHYTFVEAKRELFDMGVYALGLVYWLTGREVESVFGLTGNYVFAEHARHGLEDFGALALQLDGGLTATALGGRIGWMSHPKGGSHKVVLMGTKGAESFEAWRPRLEIYNDESGFTRPVTHPLDPMGMWASTQREAGVMPKRRWTTLEVEGQELVRDVAAFIDCLEKGREPDFNAAAAAHLTEVILAGYESAATGEAVGLPLPRGGGDGI